MVTYWSLSDSKSPQFFRTLLSILADLNKAVVWVVSTRPFTSKSSSPCNNPFVIVPIAPITIGIAVTFMFLGVFISLVSSRYFSLFCDLLGQLSQQLGKFSFFVDYLLVWSSGRYYVICLYLRIPAKFVRIILWGRYWVVHIPFVRMVKFKFLCTIASGSPCSPRRV